MGFTRRKLFQSFSLGIILSLFSPLNRWRNSNAKIQTSPQLITPLRLSKFKGLVGDNFHVTSGQSSHSSLQLVKIKEWKTDDSLEQFTLVFEGLDHEIDVVNPIRLSHPSLGRFSLCMTSTTKEERSFHYSADFSQLLV